MQRCPDLVFNMLQLQDAYPSNTVVQLFVARAETLNQAMLPHDEWVGWMERSKQEAVHMSQRVGHLFRLTKVVYSPTSDVYQHDKLNSFIYKRIAELWIAEYKKVVNAHAVA